MDEAEALIACAMSDPGILIEMKLSPEMVPGKHGAVLSLMRELSLSGVRPDFETLYMDAKMTECREILVACQDRSFSAANWQHYEGLLIEAWTVKRLSLLGKVLSDAKGKSVELINLVEKTLLDLGRVTAKNEIVKIEDLFQPWLERLSERREAGGTIPGVSWGFERIDTATLGARPGQFVVIGARPSEGKSAIGVQMLRHQGYNADTPVGLITIESSKEEVVTRFIAGGTPVDSMKTALGFVTGAQVAHIGLFLSRAVEKKDRVFIYDRPGITLTELRSAARRMVLNHGVKVIFVDYLQLIHVPGKENKIAEVQAASLGLKELARELNICVVALAQLRRDDKRERPTMGSIQWSSQIEQDADQIWLLWHKRAKESNEITESTVIIEKVRDGLTMDVKVNFDKPTVTFTEVSE